MEAGKELTITYSHENLKKGRKETVARRIVVAKVEKIEVPAGSFDAFKIDQFYRSGPLLMERWYSAQVKWFVKTRVYSSDGSLVMEDELIAFKVD